MLSKIDKMIGELNELSLKHLNNQHPHSILHQRLHLNEFNSPSTTHWTSGTIFITWNMFDKLFKSEKIIIFLYKTSILRVRCISYETTDSYVGFLIRTDHLTSQVTYNFTGTISDRSSDLDDKYFNLYHQNTWKSARRRNNIRKTVESPPAKKNLSFPFHFCIT